MEAEKGLYSLRRLGRAAWIVSICMAYASVGRHQI
jgi:hypothetical protein